MLSDGQFVPVSTVFKYNYVTYIQFTDTRMLFDGFGLGLDFFNIRKRQEIGLGNEDKTKLTMYLQTNSQRACLHNESSFLSSPQFKGTGAAQMQSMSAHKSQLANVYNHNIHFLVYK